MTATDAPEQATEALDLEVLESEYRSRDPLWNPRSDAAVVVDLIAALRVARADLAACHDRHVKDAPLFIESVHKLRAALTRAEAAEAERDTARKDRAWHDKFAADCLNEWSDLACKLQTDAIRYRAAYWSARRGRQQARKATNRHLAAERDQLAVELARARRELHTSAEGTAA